MAMLNIFFLLGALSAALAVALGAFGAHGLKSRLSAARLENYETAARYQMYHALALLAAFFASRQWPSSALPPLAGWLFIAGTLLFSGSLYLLALTDKPRWGAVTPLGGLAFIAGWICLALSPL
jgi:uncharacterized membrane protein YgdD (TMEM256/DUF423 family)